jgi:FixJ family two-component response regulator
MSSCFSRCLRVPIAIRAFYESNLWILQTLLLTHPDEDDSAVEKVLKLLFETEGYRVDLANDGRSGLERFCKGRPSAIVLDLCLPDISGREVCQLTTTVPTGATTGEVQVVTPGGTL